MTSGKAPVGPIYDSNDYRRRFPDGRIGSDPTLASVEAGERIFKTAVGEISGAWRTFAAGGLPNNG